MWPSFQLPIQDADEPPCHRSTEDRDELLYHLPTRGRGELPSHRLYLWNGFNTTLLYNTIPIMCNATLQYVEGGCVLLRRHSTKYEMRYPATVPLGIEVSFLTRTPLINYHYFNRLRRLGLRLFSSGLIVFLMDVKGFL